MALFSPEALFSLDMSTVSKMIGEGGGGEGCGAGGDGGGRELGEYKNINTNINNK